MAPREILKETPKVQRTFTKTNTTTRKPPMVTTSSTVKKTISARNIVESTPLKAKNPSEPRQRTKTVPKMNTPKPKENKSVPAIPGSVTKSAKKNWKRRPKPAHSGVPVPEKMKKLLAKQLLDSDCSF